MKERETGIQKRPKEGKQREKQTNDHPQTQAVVAFLLGVKMPNLICRTTRMMAI